MSDHPDAAQKAAALLQGHTFQNPNPKDMFSHIASDMYHPLATGSRALLHRSAGKVMPRT